MNVSELIVKYPRTLGVRAAALERVLAERRPSDRPLVVGVKIDPAQYAAQLILRRQGNVNRRNKVVANP
ncbi:MAG: hypothetical protein WCA09_00195 [Burkholderiales bacterium]